MSSGMNLSKRMVQHQGNDSRLNSLSLKLMNKGENNQPASPPPSMSGIRAPMTSPTSQPSSPRPLNSSSPFNNTTMLSPSGSNISPSGTISISPGDSRIPRPSPTALRRSASMRLRGERVSNTSRVTGSLGFTSLHNHHHNHRHGGHIIQQQPEIFPAITENGLDSPRHRSLSLSLTPARPRLGHAARTNTNESNVIDDSDVDSVKSYGSACSTASACDHAHFALNGTTWSGRSRKYVVHCSNHNGDSEQYLTPTQRAARQVRKFQTLLNDAKKEIEDKDKEILRLTKEVVELRLYKASLNSPDERTDSSDALTVRENNTFSPESPCKDLPEENEIHSPDTPDEKRTTVVSEVGELPLSLADSGHFEDDSVYSKESPVGASVVDSAASTRSDHENPQIQSSTVVSLSDDARRKIVDHYESRIEEMHRRHIDELQEVKQKHNDKVESLLNQLSEVSTRYCELRPSMDAAEAKVRELEAELDCTKVQLVEQKALSDEQEERNKQMYLKMYAKGQEAARLEHADQIFDPARDTTPRVTVSELLQQLSVTQAELENVKGTSYLPQLHISAERSQCLLSAQEAVSLWVLATRKAMYRRIVQSRNQGAIDPEITLQFLKSAIYYFLTDKENHHGHLSAIESILGFTDNEKLNIDKIYGSMRK